MFKEKYKEILVDILELELKGLTPLNWPVIPLALQDYYELAGNNREINEAHNFLIPPNELAFQGDFLVFYTENQDVVLWGINKTDLQKTDPPVYILWYEDELRVTEIKSEKAYETITEFLILMSLLQGVWGGLKFHANNQLNDKVIISIVSGYKRLATDNDLVVYGDKGLVLIVYNEREKVYGLRGIEWASNTEEKVDKIFDLIYDQYFKSK